MSNEVVLTERMLQLAREYNLSELEWEAEGVKILVRREVTEAALALPPAPRKRSIADKEQTSENWIELCAPMTGVFYRAPSPDAPPYVEVGDVVEEGQIVCLIEAMKVFNEIPADKSGRVVQICAESGQLVEQGAVLFYLAPEEA